MIAALVGTFTLPVALAVILLLFTILLFSWDSKEHGVTVVEGYPFVGTLLDFLPHKILSSLNSYRNKYGKFIRTRIFGKRVLVITDSKVAREVLMMRPKLFRRYMNVFIPILLH
jgi:hypothetical protein